MNLPGRQGIDYPICADAFGILHPDLNTAHLLRPDFMNFNPKGFLRRKQPRAASG